MGKHMKRLLKFCIDYPGWHSLSRHDPVAKRAMFCLVDHGFIEWSAGTYQFRLLPPAYERED